MLWWKKRAPSPMSPHDVGALFAAQAGLFDPQARLTVIDAGVQLGHSSKEYLDAFPNGRVFGFEPDESNFAASQALLASYGSRMELLKCAVSDRDGTSVLQVNAHNGTHSLLEIGDTRHWEGTAETVKRQPIQTVSLDRFCAERKIDRVDVLKMDIQGAELDALRGAAGLLQRAAISVVALEVSFHEIYKGQPLFWDIADHFRSVGYGFHGLFESHYHAHNAQVLSWADAIFLSPRLMELPAASQAR